MLVEDDPDIQSVGQLALEAVGGFTVQTCSSGIEAVNQASTLPPDLILLDVMMPGMDGPTTLTALRACRECENIPVIFMTAKVQAHEVAHYKALGALDVISKPFDPMRLSEMIREIWAHRALSC
jgi:CheY-like chemotaxis protein